MKITGLGDEVRTADTVYPHFRKGFDTVSHKLLIEKLMRYRLDEQIGRWAEKWLKGQAQRVVSSSTKSSRRSVARGAPQELILASNLLNIFINDLADGTVCSLRVC